LLHLAGSSVLLYLIDDARSNTNQVYIGVRELQITVPTVVWMSAAVHWQVLTRIHER